MLANTTSKPFGIASFISPHGFGHAARAAAVMEALKSRIPNIGLDIYTSVPKWFFDESLSNAFSYHYLESDIGLVQRTPTQEDLAATVKKLDVMLPFEDAAIGRLAEKILQKNAA